MDRYNLPDANAYTVSNSVSNSNTNTLANTVTSSQW